MTWRRPQAGVLERRGRVWCWGQTRQHVWSQGSVAGGSPDGQNQPARGRRDPRHSPRGNARLLSRGRSADGSRGPRAQTSQGTSAVWWWRTADTETCLSVEQVSAALWLWTRDPVSFTGLEPDGRPASRCPLPSTPCLGQPWDRHHGGSSTLGQFQGTVVREETRKRNALFLGTMSRLPGHE